MSATCATCKLLDSSAEAKAKLRQQPWYHVAQAASVNRKARRAHRLPVLPGKPEELSLCKSQPYIVIGPKSPACPAYEAAE